MHSGDKASAFRDFLHCAECDLVFVPRRFLLDEAGQRARYLEHNNDPDDEDYRRFLRRLYDEIRPHLKPEAKGLDYGAGLGPALAAMMREDGFDVRVYDPHFSPDVAALDERYDFVTCTETAEHFADPAVDFDRLHGMLRTPGWLGVMTGMLDDWSEFPSWYYHRDPTHIRFYSQRTMSWIGSRWSWEVRFPRSNVALFHKG